MQVIANANGAAASPRRHRACASAPLAPHTFPDLRPSAPQHPGRVFITDTDNHRVLVAAADAQLSSPQEIAIDAVGHVFIADGINHRVISLGPLP